MAPGLSRKLPALCVSFQQGFHFVSQIGVLAACLIQITLPVVTRLEGQSFDKDLVGPGIPIVHLSPRNTRSYPSTYQCECRADLAPRKW